MHRAYSLHAARNEQVQNANQVSAFVASCTDCWQSTLPALEELRNLRAERQVPLHRRSFGGESSVQDHQLVVITGPGRHVPARLTAVPIPEDTELTNIQLSRAPDINGWRAQLTVRVATPERLGLIVNRLDRLIDVHRVVVLGQASARRSAVETRQRRAGDLRRPVAALLRAWKDPAQCVCRAGVFALATRSGPMEADFAGCTSADVTTPIHRQETHHD
jgi:hypothetical protein